MTHLVNSAMAITPYSLSDEPLLRLHSQLEIAPLLEEFTAWATLSVNFTQLHYRHPGLGLFELVAHPAAEEGHECALHTLAELGELYFLRAIPFSREEQQRLLQCVDTLRHPLANAVLYHTVLRHCDALTQRLRLREQGCCSLNPLDGREQPQALDTLVTSGALHDALHNGALTLAYQPKVELQSGQIRGMEALLRWHHADRGLLSPELFIPLAERSGLIPVITRWVLNAVLRQCGLWQQQGILVPIAVNLSSLDLEDVSLPDYLAQLLEAWEIPPQFIELEITETAAFGDPLRSIEVLQRLSKLGVAVAIDDFGIGYSSLERLKQLPVNTIKIDKSFVMEEGRGEHDMLFVDSITRLGHQLGMKVVAEGVDSHESWQRLLATGCDMAQGYHISRPLSDEAITGWLHDSARNSYLHPCH